MALCGKLRMGNKEVEYDYCICTFVNENHESIIENKKTPDTTGVGGRSGARTPDPLIKSQLLYQLS